MITIQQERQTVEGLTVITLEIGGKFCLRIYRGEDRPGKRPLVNYAFRSAEDRDKYLAGVVERQKAANIAHAERRAAQAVERAAFDARQLVKVGDLFSHSWGYDQTNIEFFQVVGVTSKTALVRQIESEHVEGSAGFMSEDRRPVPGKFCETTYNFTGGRINPAPGQPLRAKVRAGYKGAAALCCEHGCCSKIEANETHYHSWYA